LPAFPSGSYSWSPHAVSLGSSSGSASGSVLCWSSPRCKVQKR
jgi:hypothetical protein